MAKQNSVEILIRARDGASKSLEEVRDSVKGVGTEARASIRPLTDYRAELKHQVSELGRVAQGLDKNSDEYKKVVEELAKTKGELRSVNDELRNSETAWDRAGGKITSLGAKLSLGVTAPLTALAGAGIASAMQLETFSASLEVLIGDAERANAVFDELYEFSANVPFDWRTISEGTRILSAFGIEAEDTVATLSQLGDIAAGTQSDLTGLAEIYGRVAVTGRVSMQEVNSLALRGVPIYQELAKVVGVSSEEVRELVSDGVVGFTELQQVITNLTGEGGKFSGMMAAQAETVAGHVAKLKDSFEQILDIIGERLLPYFDALVGHAQRAVEWFVALDESTQGLFVGLGAALAASGPLLVGFGTILTMVPKMVEGFKLVRAAITPLTGPLGLLAAVAAAAIWVNNALDEGKQPRQNAQDSYETLIERMATYRNELVVTSEAERQAAIEALNRQRRVLEVTIQNQEAFIRSVEADVIAFANKGFFGQLFSFGAANVDLKTLEQAEQHVKGLRGELEAIDSSIESIATMVIPPPQSDVPKLTKQVKDLTNLPDPKKATETWLQRFTRTLQEGVEGALVGVGELMAESLPGQLQSTRYRSRYLEVGQFIAENIAEGFLAVIPDLGVRLQAGLDALIWGTRGLRARPTSSYVEDAAATRAEQTQAFDENPGLFLPAYGMPDNPAGILYNALHALVQADAPLDDIRAAVDALTAVMPLSVAQISQLTNGLIGGRVATEEYAAAAVKAAEDAAKAWDEFPTLVIPEGGYTPAWHLRAPAAAERWTGLTGTSGAPVGHPTAVTTNHDWAALIARDTLEAMVDSGAGLDEIRKAADAWSNVAPQTVAELNRVTGGLYSMALEAAKAADRTAAVQAFDENPGLFLPAYDMPKLAPAPLTTAERLEQVAADRTAEAQAFDENPGLFLPAYDMPNLAELNAQREKERQEALAKELAARQAVVDGLTTMSAEKGALGNFGAALTNLVVDQVPAFGAALDGFVQAGPIGAIIGFFTELLAASEPMQEAFLLVNEALAPLGELLGRIIAPALKLLGTVIGWVVDALVAIYNFLLGWLLGRIERDKTEPPDAEQAAPPKDPPKHSDIPPPGGRTDFGGVSPGVQLAVATPFLEAAQLQIAAAQLHVTAANSLLAVIGRMEAMYSRVLSEGFKVVVQVPTPDGSTTSGTAYLR